MIKIGFWAQVPPNHPASVEGDLPWPSEFYTPNWDDDERLKIAVYLDSGEEHAAYKGWSTCRLCGIMNGSTDLTDGKYLWPQGYSHYIREHKIRPPQIFIDWALSRLTSGMVQQNAIKEVLKAQQKIKDVAAEILAQDPRVEMVNVSRDHATPLTLEDGYLNSLIEAPIPRFSTLGDGYTASLQRTADNWERMSFDEKAAAVRRLTNRRTGGR